MVILYFYRYQGRAFARSICSVLVGDAKLKVKGPLVEKKMIVLARTWLFVAP